MPQGLTLKLTGDISSRPYIDLTLCMMRDFHAKADWIDSNTIRVEPQPYAPCSYTIESDWTAASYWYALMALAPETTAHILLPPSTVCPPPSRCIASHARSIV